ncbi:hypothetical protein A8F94_05830 [Bacillus sp. FJAT-27225]|uniref:hypothetical protein n=1 Tax=Bacillus sp. FJAT-27225 TaxID=1743144 RepID=UPI00080C3033|nr:hypothetical protein [Bacillus sp. FJAT-27225]OCA91376.1 hypothetical protein A8F94_05830 [Bacillus sp. FJAT-27225]
MRRNRLLICLLLAILMVYYAVPRLSLEFSSEAGAFTIAWAMAALLVIGGNMAGLVKEAKGKTTQQTRRKKPVQARGRGL